MFYTHLIRLLYNFYFTFTLQSRSFERQICAQTQIQTFKKFNMSQMNRKEIFHNTTYSVQLTYIAGHSLEIKNCK